MVISCWVNGCTNRAHGSAKRSFYNIPKIRKFEGPQTEELSSERRRVWLRNINRKDQPSNTSRICSDHFYSGRPAGLYDKSNPDWAPTLKLTATISKSESAKELQLSESKLKRYRRVKERVQSKETLHCARALLDLATVSVPEVLPGPVGTNEEKNPELFCEMQQVYEHDYAKSAPAAIQVCNMVLDQEEKNDYSEQPPVCESQIDSELQRLITENIMLKEQLNDLKYNEKSFENSNIKVRYYTGLPPFLMLMSIFDLVKSFIPKQKQNSDLGQFERLVMTLMCLKLNLPVQDLAFRFQTSTSTVSRTFIIVIHALYTRLKKLLYWPERDELRKTMPLEFRKHFVQRTAVIIDCFEVFIQRPKNLLARAQTWSNYKYANTVKFLIGITPQGSVSILSKAWGGRASDKCITESCGLLLKLLPGDLILADRGCNIQDSVKPYCAEVNIPTFTKGKAQLSAVDIETTRKIAHARIHVERVIGLVRNKYTMLQSRLPIDFLISNGDGLPVVDKIATVACVLTNLCDSVVPLA